MGTQVNWQRIRTELQRLADVEKLKSEVHRIGGELRRFDYHTVLSPKAAGKVEQIEKRYDDLMRRLHVAQRHVDRELGRILKQIKSHRDDAANVFTQQRDKLEQVSSDFRERFKSKRGSRPRKSATSDRGSTTIERSLTRDESTPAPNERSSASGRSTKPKRAAAPAAAAPKTRRKSSARPKPNVTRNKTTIRD